MPAKLQAAPKVAEGFYTSREWRQLAARVKRQRGGRCEFMIEVQGIKVRCGSADRVIADHIVERKDGGAELDEANIELLCSTHHNMKTAKAKARRALGQADRPRGRGGE
jgi:5-methylcytosine-specific restriction endonuclease McrA